MTRMASTPMNLTKPTRFQIEDEGDVPLRDEHSSRRLRSSQQRQSSARLRCRRASTQRLSYSLSKREMSMASILLGSSSSFGGKILEDDTAMDLLPFLFDYAPPSDIKFSKVPIPDHVLRLLFVVLYVLQLVGSVVFLRFLTVAGWNDKSPVTSALFVGTEAIAFLSTNMFLFNGLLGVFPREDEISSLKLTEGLDTAEKVEDHDEVTDFSIQKIPEDVEVEIKESELPVVAVCVCRYKEPLDDLILTVDSAVRIKWPANKLQLYILDDGWFDQDRHYQREQAVGLTDILGVDDIRPPRMQVTEEIHRSDCATECHFWEIREASVLDCQVTLIARKKPDVSHYKAGNLNNFLYNFLGDAAKRLQRVPQYMVMLDHDMLPHPEFVSDAVSRLKHDSNKAFVQYPQRFYDIKGSDLLYAGNEIFFDGVQINRSRVGLTAFAGTNALWNLQSIYHVGGFQYGSLTEDASTGLAVNLAGYTSSYALRELAVGQSPQTVEDAMQQRMRWSQGAIEILLHHTKCILTCRSPFASVELPQALARYFCAERPVPPSMGKKIIMFFIFFDSMVYPFYSVGFILHAVISVMYLFNAEAPIAPADPTQLLYYWLPLYIVKAACQVIAFPSVSLATQWNSQMAWAGYSLSTLASVRKGLCGSGGWFNTGAAKKDRFWLQYGNTAVALIIYIMIIYRAIAFIAIDKSCTAWMTAGSLLYGMVMLAHVRSWAIEPFRQISQEQEANNMMLHELLMQENGLKNSREDATKNNGKVQEKAMRQATQNREENQSLDLSLLFLFLHVVLVSFLLFFWASGNCDETGSISAPTTTFTYTGDEYCNFNDCNGISQGGNTCNSGRLECIACGGQWCAEKAEIQTRGIATTTRYWDCAGGTCGCGFQDSRFGLPVHCHSNALFDAPEGNEFGAIFYGAAAVSFSLGGGDWMSEACGSCWKVTGASNIPFRQTFNSTLVLKGTNYCPPINDKCDGKPHFDIAVPGFDHAASSFANDCEALEPNEIEGFSACGSYSPFQHGCNCSLFKSPTLRAGCENFLALEWDNPTVDFEQVTCPPELSSLPCWEQNQEAWPADPPGLCLDPFASS